MLRAYFDTSVPSGIVNGQVLAEDVVALKAAFTRGELIAPIGPVILDELAGELAGNRDGMIKKLKLLQEFGTFHGMLKQPSDILKEAIQAYAGGNEPPVVTLPEDERRNSVRVLTGVIAGSRSYDADFQVVVGGVSALKLDWLANRHDAHREVDANPAWQQVKAEANPQSIPFQDYFAGSAADFAIAAAEALGLADSRRQRGAEGLLKLPTMRIVAGIALAQIYGEMIGRRDSRAIRTGTTAMICNTLSWPRPSTCCSRSTSGWPITSHRYPTFRARAWSDRSWNSSTPSADTDAYSRR